MLTVIGVFLKKLSLSSLTTNKIVYVFILLMILTVNVALRVYKVTETTEFQGDQGSDLLVAEDILQGYPRQIGPILGIDNFSTPPTYYYVLAILSWVGKKTFGELPTVLYSFVIFNVIFSLCFTFIVQFLYKNKWVSLLGLLMVSIPTSLVFEARNIWQPHLLNFFLSFAILFQLFGYKKKSELLIFLSLLLYFFSVSIYPTPVFLLPFFLSQVWIFFRERKKMAFWHSVVFTFLFFSIASLIWYGNFLLHEYSIGFPSVRAIISQSGIDTASKMSVVAVTVKNLHFMSATIFPKMYGFPQSSFWIGLLIVGYCGAMVILSIFMFVRNTKKTFFRNFFTPLPILFLGGSFAYFFSGEVHPHRLMVLLPLFFIQLLSCFVYLYHLDKRIGFISIIIFLFLFVPSNFKAAASLASKGFSTQNLTLRESKKIASTIDGKIKAENFQYQEVGIYMFSPVDTDNYQLSAIKYLLRNNLNIYFVKEGNDLGDRWFYPQQKKVYLICREFYEKIDDCKQIFVKKNIGLRYTLTSQEEIEPDKVLLIWSESNDEEK